MAYVIDPNDVNFRKKSNKKLNHNLMYSALKLIEIISIV